MNNHLFNKSSCNVYKNHIKIFKKKSYIISRKIINTWSKVFKLQYPKEVIKYLKNILKMKHIPKF